MNWKTWNQNWPMTPATKLAEQNTSMLRTTILLTGGLSQFF